MIDINNSVLNQRGTPVIYSGNYDGGNGLPTGTIIGRVFIDNTGTAGIFQQEYNGDWVNIASGGSPPPPTIPSLQEVTEVGSTTDISCQFSQINTSFAPITASFNLVNLAGSASYNGMAINALCGFGQDTASVNFLYQSSTFGIVSSIVYSNDQIGSGSFNMIQSSNINTIGSFSAQAYVFTNTGTYTISHYSAFQTREIFGSGGTQRIISNFYNFLIDPIKTGITITNDWGIYQRQSATNNFFGGKVAIGSNTLDSNILKVVGNTGLTGLLTTTTTFTSTANASTYSILGNSNATIPAGTSFGNAGYVFNAIVGVNVLTYQGSATYANSNVPSGIFSQNQFNFSAAGSTITLTQSSGIRTISGQHILNSFAGTNSGTITHLSGLQILGLYNQSNGVTTPVITNMYQLLINDTGDYGHTFTITNKWGIYQAGTTDNNYLAGDLLLGTLTPTGRQLVVNGSPEFLNAISGSSGGNSGQHLIVYLDGVQYKIKLENP